MPVPRTDHVHKQKGLGYGEINIIFGVGASTACEKVNTVSTDEILFKPVPVPGLSVQVISLELYGTQIHPV